MIWTLLPFGMVVIFIVAMLWATRPRDKEWPQVEVASANVIYLRPPERSRNSEGSASRRLAIIRKSSLLR